MKIMIVESPNKTKKISAILGADWKVVASVGHVRDLPRDEMGVSLDDFVPKYVATDRGADVLKRLENEVKSASEIYLATDPDREGEAISWHLQQALKLKNYKRVTFTEITKSGIDAGLRNARKIDIQLVAAQEARRVLDRLVGYTVSPELCRIFGDKLSAGRVQSPALKILVLREREIRNFISRKHFAIEAAFPWRAHWNFANFAAKGQDLWEDRAVAEQVAKIKFFDVRDCQETERHRAPPAPFTTSSLQQGASASLGMGAKKCMELAQELFAAGLITYHRTDSPNLSEDAIQEIRAFAQANKLPLPDQPRKFKSKDSAQEAHEAIRPTHINDKTPTGIAGDALALYEMIWKRAVACQLADAVYDVRKVILHGGELDGKEVIFSGIGSMLKARGWKAIMDDAAENEDGEDPEMSNPVPKLARGDKLTANSVSLQEKTTSPPARYTQAKLVKKLEDEGIGRPSTYAAIIEGLLVRHYAEEKKKLFVPTNLGEKVLDMLDGKFSFLELDFTRELEQVLDRVAEGKVAYKESIRDSYNRLMLEMPVLQKQESTAEAAQPCPSCGKGSLRRRNGPNGFFWGCSAWRDGCKHTQPDDNGKPGQRVDREPLATEGPACPECGKGFMRRIKGQKGYFWGCSEYRGGCKKTLQDKDGQPVLPQ